MTRHTARQCISFSHPIVLLEILSSIQSLIDRCIVSYLLNILLNSYIRSFRWPLQGESIVKTYYLMFIINEMQTLFYTILQRIYYNHKIMMLLNDALLHNSVVQNNTYSDSNICIYNTHYFKQPYINVWTGCLKRIFLHLAK